jgi:peptidylprolyl isomerase
VVALVALGWLVACGDASSTSDTSAAETTVGTGADSSIEPPSTDVAVAKPEVQLPAQPPTELQITDLVTGTGPAAKAGDNIVVRYVGVRSVDGVEFDNNFEKGTPFNLTLGAGGVIEGWDLGLVGAQAGGRRQLDIPADLAYGSAGRGELIRGGDALSFVIDVLAVIPQADPADEPQITVPPSANVESFTSEDLVVGEGARARSGQTVAVHIIAFRADTGERLNSTWESGTPFTFEFGKGEAILGLELTVNKMNVGGRRLVTIPFSLAFGDEGSEALGLPPSTDLVLVVDLVAAF